MPLHPDLVKEHDGEEGGLSSALVSEHRAERMYAVDRMNRFLEVTYANGDKEILYFKDFNSGAMIENVVARGQEAGDQALPRRGAEGASSEDDLMRRHPG